VRAIDHRGCAARDRAKRSSGELEEDLRKTIELASDESLSKGLTTITDAGSPPATIEPMRKLVDELLAASFHPDRVDWPLPSDGLCRWC